MNSHEIATRAREAANSSLPHPATGSTEQRFRGFGALGRENLSVAKLVEPHHDAAAILAELGGAKPETGSLWAVWAAEPPFARLSATLDGEQWRLTGRKAFCSGAALVTDALVTAHADDGARMFAIDMDAARQADTLSIEDRDWTGAGMQGADTRTVEMSDLQATAIGAPGDYTDRPGFWHGATGVAACWLGGACGIADVLVHATAAGRVDAHGKAHLGAIVALLDAAWAQLARAAMQCDRDPQDADGLAQALALSVRETVAGVAEHVISRVGRALGPGPLAFDEAHAQRVTDLQVFIRQHHAERDLVTLGEIAAEQAVADAQ